MRTEQYQKIELYRNMAIEEGLDSDKGSLQFQMDFFFGGIDFTNKRIADSEIFGHKNIVQNESIHY